MPTPPLTDKTIAIVQRALAECAGRVRAAHRLLTRRGIRISQGSVSNIASSDDDLESQLIASRAREHGLAAHAATLQRRIGNLLEHNDSILSAVRTIKPLPPVRFPQPAGRGKPVSAVMLISDWQIGEVISEAQTEGFNSFDYATAETRVTLLGHAFSRWARVLRRGYNIPELHILVLGDMVSGDIHDELRETNEFPAPVAVVKAANLLSAHIASLAPLFSRIFVEEIGADNHGRITRKPRYKNKSLDNLNYPLFAIVNQALSGHRNITIRQYESARAQVDISGFSFLCDHGDSVRSWFGIPYYGMQREDGMEAMKRMATRSPHKPFDMRIRGHWHYAAIGPFGLVNGSLAGMTELDYLSGRFTTAAQVSFLVHPDHGFFNWTRWDLQLRAARKEPKNVRPH